MNCEERREAQSALVDGELGGAERAELETHLETCDACRAALADHERLDALLRALPQVTPAPDFEARFWARVARERAAAETGGLSGRLRAWLRPAVLAGLSGVAAASVAAFVLLHQTPTSTSAALDPDARLVVNERDFELIQDDDMDVVSDVDVLEDWDADQPS
jgi:anti-sigma factor RsiW